MKKQEQLWNVYWMVYWKDFRKIEVEFYNRKRVNNMTKELYEELRQIEDILYDIVMENGDINNTELGDVWSALYSYLEKVKPINL